MMFLSFFMGTHISAFFAASGVIFAAYYMLPMVQSVFLNALDEPENRAVQDLSRREIAILAPMAAGTIPETVPMIADTPNPKAIF